MAQPNQSAAEIQETPGRAARKRPRYPPLVYPGSNDPHADPESSPRVHSRVYSRLPIVEEADYGVYFARGAGISAEATSISNIGQHVQQPTSAFWSSDRMRCDTTRPTVTRSTERGKSSRLKVVDAAESDEGDDEDEDVHLAVNTLARMLDHQDFYTMLEGIDALPESVLTDFVSYLNETCEAIEGKAGVDRYVEQYIRFVIRNLEGREGGTLRSFINKFSIDLVPDTGAWERLRHWGVGKSSVANVLHCRTSSVRESKQAPSTTRPASTAQSQVSARSEVSVDEGGDSQALWARGPTTLQQCTANVLSWFGSHDVH